MDARAPVLKTCLECSEPAASKGRCTRHYQAWRNQRKPGEGGAVKCNHSEGCQNIAVAKGVCLKHYQKARTSRAETDPNFVKCKEEGCKRQVYAKKRCQRHYAARRKRSRAKAAAEAQSPAPGATPPAVELVQSGPVPEEPLLQAANGGLT